ncbi:GntR family transcriptional regulator [Mesomycoplasma neurolyticum]|uniref:GntR family transcriptional regulator n=1 Tax=Mesomycoplasma neurolyticum TaxID=2120 RepID=A0A449A5B7_9BACT|nr:GntR family transcriptional regulator [Mesomycoplasma neurolyticum]VEU59414.1 GntR family transcriptional regulator [Mesomycoplasma neurolyticum]
MTTKKEIVLKYLIDLIVSKKKKPNEIMPSEGYLMLRFKISRITAINAYKKLEAIGAVYNISKQGRFVAENFFGLIKPFSFSFPINKVTINKIYKKEPKWFKDFNIIFDYGYAVFQKQYFKNSEEIMMSENFISKKYNIPKTFNDTFSFTNFLLEKENYLKNTVYKLRYEKVNMYGFEYLVVVYSWSYDEEGIAIASRFVVKPKYFQFSHQEKNLF